MAIKKNNTLKYHDFVSFYKTCVKKPYLDECNDMKVIHQKMDDIAPGVSGTVSGRNIIKTIHLQ